MEQLTDAMSLADAVDVRDLILGDGREVQVDLIRSQPRWNPGVLLQCAATVIVGLGIIVTAASSSARAPSRMLVRLLLHIGREIRRKRLLMVAWTRCTPRRMMI